MEWINVKDKLPNRLENVLVKDKYTTSKDEIYIAFHNGLKWIAYAADCLDVNAGWDGGTIESNIYQEDVECWQPLPDIM